ncbi:hypothetical protein [Frateuria soli]|uniref:hypothetical protein n=1 Tax=Frateuria soli TaxID=1542730 RepID=UPI001E639D06|nr:hypothetical protein [Frateuria soli]UGB38702.1 hypothetical protein LQ771_02270 [Frateuria soli]
MDEQQVSVGITTGIGKLHCISNVRDAGDALYDVWIKILDQMKLHVCRLMLELSGGEAVRLERVVRPAEA